ncbi:MAG: phosphoglycerate mutase family protein [Acidobacteriota bacterium]|nr:histidine phosphatase family protein [Blastocatellia bacterium]MDW8411067.1 phosphoglycerate mutase family protein [Acidobacteriota bacterium]
MTKLVLIFSVASWLYSAPSPCSTATVIIVRHAEKQTGQDPELSEKGRQRAELLAEMLKDAKVKRIYASEYRRTLQTVEPLAKQLSLQVIRYAAAESQSFARKLRLQASGTVLIAAHSNTIAEILQGLGIEDRIEVSEDDYSGIYLVTLCADHSVLTILRYGD